MLRRIAYAACVAGATTLPALSVYASETTLAVKPETPAGVQQSAPAKANTVFIAPETKSEARATDPATGLKLETGAPSIRIRTDEFRFAPARDTASNPAASNPLGSAESRYGLSSSASAAGKLNLSSSGHAIRPGWQLSGRAGPLRWLSPLDGEGDTQLRLGGRVPGQPRMPGMGLFNVGIHYNFE